MVLVIVAGFATIRPSNQSMQKANHYALLVFPVLLILCSLILVQGVRQGTQRLKQTPAPPAPTVIQVNGRSILQYSQDYTIVLVGDSMTEKLGNGDELRTELKRYYPDKTVEILNYGFGSTNILSVPERLTNTTSYGRDFRPVTDVNFDLIIIESFGHNPLSTLPLEEGLRKQNDTLDGIVALLRVTNPKATIAFVATIAPNKDHYAEGKVDLAREERQKWAAERMAYIENHIRYATHKNIPTINVYEESLDRNRSGKLEYINDEDHMHPSPKGVQFISKIMAADIYKNNLLR